MTDYNKQYVDTWIQENVIDKLMVNNKNIDIYSEFEDYEITYAVGTKQEVSIKLKEWLDNLEDEQIVMVSDVCHYDMVLFIDLFGTAFDLPKYIVPCCYDINQMLSDRREQPLKTSFDETREDLIPGSPLQDIEYKHNSLYDALVIKEIFENNF